MEKAKLSATKDYRLFDISDDNRNIDLAHRKALRESLRKYGWIPAYPMDVQRRGTKLVIVDGQHRFRMAQELNISVWYVITESKHDVADVNAAQKSWSIRNYAERYAKKGIKDYEQVLTFAADHNIGINVATGLLYGHADARNVSQQFKAGTYKVRDVQHANKCARIFEAVRHENQPAANMFCMAAIQLIVRVLNFDENRMIKGIARRGDLLRHLPTREAYLDVLQEIYNDRFSNTNRIPLRFEAENILAKRKQCMIKKSERT